MNLKKHRLKAGLTQEQLAQRIKHDDGKPYTQKYIQYLESGRRKGSNIGLLMKLSKVLKVSLKKLVED